MTHPDQQYSDEQINELFGEIARSYDEQTIWEVCTKVKALVAAREQRLLDRIGDEVIGKDEQVIALRAGLQDATEFQKQRHLRVASRNGLRDEQRQKLAAIRSKL